MTRIISASLILRFSLEARKLTLCQPPTFKQFILNINMEEKMQDCDFLADFKRLLRPMVEFNPLEAYEVVKARLIDRLKK